MKLNDVLSFFDTPSVARGRTVIGAYSAVVDALQRHAEQMNDTTAAVFISQRPPRDADAERAYREQQDRLHAEAVAILRARGR